tara:strand:+ start:3357 stop:3602 length:246 start_codon:yes stop_codon:yes gene_type:complete
MIKFIFLIFILYVLIYNTIQTKVTIEPFEIFLTCPKSFNCNYEKIKKQKRMEPLPGYTSILDLILSPENSETPLGLDINYF